MYEQRNCQKVAYICDLKACGDTCPNDMCHHTFDISHAANFECFNPDSDDKRYIEKEKKMTCKEKLMIDHPDYVGPNHRAGCVGCPCNYGYAGIPEWCDGKEETCKRCWDRKVEKDFKKENTSMIKDSGERTEFATGAVRDIREGKGRCDLMPLDVVAKTFIDVDLGYAEIITSLYTFKKTKDVGHLYAILRNHICKEKYVSIANLFLDVSIHFEEGAKKYGENNWQKGIPVHCYLDSAIRHYLKYVRGDDDEPHYRAFVWNIICCIWTCENHPELIDI